MLLRKKHLMTARLAPPPDVQPFEYHLFFTIRFETFSMHRIVDLLILMAVERAFAVDERRIFENLPVKFASVSPRRYCDHSVVTAGYVASACRVLSYLK